jgi:hypothetical protein
MNQVGSGSDLGVSAWVKAHAELSELAKRRAAQDWEEGTLLLEALRTGVHRHLGFGTFSQYVERLLGYSHRATQEEVRVAEALEFARHEPRSARRRAQLVRGARAHSLRRRTPKQPGSRPLHVRELRDGVSWIERARVRREREPRRARSGAEDQGRRERAFDRESLIRAALDVLVWGRPLVLRRIWITPIGSDDRWGSPADVIKADDIPHG